MTVINFASRSGAQDFMEELRAKKLHARLWNRNEERPGRCERYCFGGFLKATMQASGTSPHRSESRDRLDDEVLLGILELGEDGQGEYFLAGFFRDR